MPFAGVPRLQRFSIGLAKTLRTALFKKDEEFRHLCRVRLENLAYVKEPLILVSQIQRSGGTLLSQLFDGHPQCHAHPHELYIGYPDKATWPTLSLADKPKVWFNMLFETPVEGSFLDGYKKHSDSNPDEPDTHPFIFLPSLQKAIFKQCVSARVINSQRDILDCYMTSYFNAWLDNQNLYATSKKVVTAFVPRMSMKEKNLDEFFGAYPDGKLISIVRDPKSWYASARKHSPKEYENIGDALRLWRLSTIAAIKAKEQYANRVYIVSFENLIKNTETTMRSLANYLGIDFSPTLLMPTFNGLPIKADSSYSVKAFGIIQAPLVRHKEVLTTEEVAYLDTNAFSLFEQAINLSE